jgi:predicted acetyltransferase
VLNWRLLQYKRSRDRQRKENAMNSTIRKLQGQEMLAALYALNSYALHPSPPLQSREEWEAIVSARQGITCVAAFEESNPVSVAASTPMTQNIRGKLFPASGIWGVSTSPAARRKGYCRKLMQSLLSSDRDAGKIFSNLYPFRESFYERMGYVAFPLTKIVHFNTLSLEPLLNLETGGEIRQQYIGEAFDAYREYLAGMRENVHGMVCFDFGDRVRANQNLQWIAQAIFDDQVEGLMMYRTMGDEVSKYNFVASRFYYKTSRARYLLLNWIARHIDQADRAELWLAPDEFPEMWLADLQMKVEAAVRPAMCRVLDIERLSGMRVGEGSFSARVIDPLCPWNEADWSFTSMDGKLEVSRAASPECVLTIQGLSAVINGTHNPQDFPYRDWGDPDPRMQHKLLNMFPPMTPYIHEYF